MFALHQHLLQELIVQVQLFLFFPLQLCVFPQGFFRVGQRGLELQSRGTGLGRMCLVYNDGIVTTRDFVHLLIDHRELLERGDNDADAVVDGVPQILGSFVLADGLYRAERVIKAGDGLLQLGVQHRAVSDHNNAGEHRPIFVIVQGGQAVGCPGDGVGLAGTRGVLNQIVVPRAVCAHIGQKLAHHVQLMIAWEDQLFIFRGMDELLHNVHHAVLPEDILPEVGGRIAVGIGGVTLAAVIARAVGALVEGQKDGIFPCKLCGHPDLQLIHAEIAQDALVELEADLPRVAVVHPLALGVVHRLPGVLVFQFESKHRDAVDRKHHVHGFVLDSGIKPLAVTGDLIGRVLLCRSLVQAGLRPEIADAEAHTPVLEAMAQHMQQSVHITGGVKGLAELSFRFRIVLHDEARPLLRLGLLYEADQCLWEQPQLGIISVMICCISSRW